MKKLLTVLVATTALLAACSEDKSSEAEKKADEILANAPELTDEDVAELEEKAAANKGSENTGGALNFASTQLTPEAAKEQVEKVTTTAKEDNVIQKAEIKEVDKEVTAHITFNEDVTEDAKNTFIFNYSLLAQQQYPDQTIKFEIEE